jgi:uncharacterized protein YgiM (DUF1202 family)
MGLFDNINKAVTRPQEAVNYNSVLIKAGVTISNIKFLVEGNVLSFSGGVNDIKDGEKATAALKQAFPNFQIKNYTEVEDLSSQNIFYRIATQSSNLNIRKGPGIEYDIVGKAAHNSKVQLIKKMYNGWYFIKDADGEEGFSSSEYLELIP